MTPSIHYHICPIDPAGHRFEVRLKLSQFEPQTLTLQLPNWIAGSYMIRDFSKNIETISALDIETPSSSDTHAYQSTPASQLKQIDTDTWQCDITEEGLCIRYIVYAWDLSVRCAHLDETHGFFNPTSLCLRVQGADHLPHLMTIYSTEKTSHWSIYTSLMPVGDTQRHAFGTYQAKDYDELADSPVEMGTPHYLSFEACGALHEMVFTGIMPNTDWERIKKDVQTICEAQIKFFEPQTQKAPFLDSSDRYVFMSMVTGDSYGGLEHRASTALMCSRNNLPVIGQKEASPEYLEYLGLVSHEYFHTWNVKRIKPQAFAPYNLNKTSCTKLLWVFEGFTDYFDEVFLHRTGIMSNAAYMNNISKTLQGISHKSGLNKQSLTQSSFNAWNKYYKQDENSPNAIVSYYAKGSIAAMCLDAYIQEHSRYSLDDVMRALWNTYGRDFFIKKNYRGLPEDGFIHIAQQATGLDLSDFIHRYIEGIEPLPVKKSLETLGMNLEWTASSSTPYVGWRTRNLQGECVLSTVLEHSPAHQGGLSAQDTLVAINHLKVTPDNVNQLLSRYQPKDEIQVHVFRRDELRVFHITLGEPIKDKPVITPSEKKPSALSRLKSLLWS